METKNAIITSTMLGIEDHGVMLFYLYLDYGDGGHQGAGGYILDTPIKQGNTFLRRVGTAEGLSLIMKVLEVVGVRKWEDLKGKYVKVKSDFGKVHAIGNIIKDEWLDFEQFFKEIKTFTKLIKNE